MKINLSVAAYTFVIGIVISLFVAIIFNDVSMSITTSICYLAAVLAGIIFEMKNYDKKYDPHKGQGNDTTK